MRTPTGLRKAIEKLRSAASEGLVTVHRGMDVLEDALGGSNSEVESALLRRVMHQVDSVFPVGYDGIERITFEIRDARRPTGIVRFAVTGGAPELVSELTLEWDELPDRHRREMILNQRFATVVYERPRPASSHDEQRQP